MNTLLQVVAANQRFLGKTNPIMTAAVADSGSILDREYIQRAARGIVDAGHLDNLKLWVCAGLPKLRNSGGVDYVPKLYDLSGNGNNGVQTTEANQAVWGATGLTFDGSDDRFLLGSPLDTKFNFASDFTINLWIKLTSSDQFDTMIANADAAGRGWRIWTNEAVAADRVFRFRTRKAAINNDAVSTTKITNAWMMVTGVCRSTGYKNTIYINSTSEGETNYDTIDYTDGATTKNVPVIADQTSNIDGTTFYGRVPNGILNDIRIYNTALTGDQITAIYNQTSYRYA